MELRHVKFGGTYYCKKNLSPCVVIASHYADGAALIVELIEDGDTCGELRGSEACHLLLPESQ